MLTLLLGMTAYAFGLVTWVIAVLRGRRRHSWGWFAGTAVLLLPPAAVTYFVGIFAGGLDVAESCAPRRSCVRRRLRCWASPQLVSRASAVQRAA